MQSFVGLKDEGCGVSGLRVKGLGLRGFEGLGLGFRGPALWVCRGLGSKALGFGAWAFGLAPSV